jgi:hypothetical protein
MANIRFDPDAIIRKNFGGPGGTRLASTTEQLIAKQTVLTRGSTISERSVSLSENSVAENSAPPNATAAPSKGQNSQFVGLCEALNQHQQKLVKDGTYGVADEYAIDFAPPAIGASEVVKPDLVYKNTAGKNVKTAQDQLDSTRDAVAVNSQIWNVLAGTQIVQLIDQIMRSSRYITDQQKVNFDQDGKQTKNEKASDTGVTAWYKISITAKQLGYDKKRRDFAYRMTFTITPYAINQMASQYFPDSTYRGAHKAYNYWFTGLNTQILSYEQEYNHAYYSTLSGNAEGLAVPPPSGRDQFKQTHMATSEQRGQGQANYVNAPADSAAAFLYSVSDFSHVQMKIVGDPAFMQQGEVAFGVNARSFEFRPFNADGGINYDSQEVTFTVSFSRPTDYNFNTGIMNTNSGSGAPQETFAYIATHCKNVFSKGQFTQELEGSLLPLGNTSKPPADNGRSPTTASALRTTNINGESLGYEVQDETGAVSNLRRNEYGDLYDPAGTAGSALPSPQPAPPPAAPTSSGDIRSPFAGQVSPFAGQVSPFAGQVSPFAGQVSPFAGQVSPFAPNTRAPQKTNRET